MNKKQIALTLYTIRNFCQTEKDLVKSLQKVKNIGYSAIQVSSIGPINPRIVKNICDDLELLIWPNGRCIALNARHPNMVAMAAVHWRSKFSDKKSLKA